jgi:hypothetical protein
MRIASEQANSVRAAIDRIGVLYRSPDFARAARAALRNLNAAIDGMSSGNGLERRVPDEISSALDGIASADTAAERNVKVSTL